MSRRAERGEIARLGGERRHLLDPLAGPRAVMQGEVVQRVRDGGQRLFPTAIAPFGFERQNEVARQRFPSALAFETARHEQLPERVE